MDEHPGQLALFPEPPAVQLPLPVDLPDPVPALSADQRRTRRQAADLAAGTHPVTRMPLHPDAAPADDRDAPGLRCGTCAHRQLTGGGSRSYGKCWLPGFDGPRVGHPFVTHSAASDVRRWWPACTGYAADGGA